MQMSIYITDPRYGFNQMYCFYNIILYANEHILIHDTGLIEYSVSITLYYMQMSIYCSTIRV